MTIQPAVTFSSEEWQDLRTKFSEAKHTLNNALAVFMALSELAHRDPENYKKLERAIETRTPDIVRLMQDVTMALDAKLEMAE